MCGGGITINDLGAFMLHYLLHEGIRDEDNKNALYETILGIKFNQYSMRLCKESKHYKIRFQVSKRASVSVTDTVLDSPSAWVSTSI